MMHASPPRARPAKEVLAMLKKPSAALPSSLVMDALVLIGPHLSRVCPGAVVRPLRFDHAAQSTLVRICGIEEHSEEAKHLWKAVTQALVLYRPLAELDALNASLATQHKALRRLATSTRHLQDAISIQALHLTLLHALTGAGTDFLTLQATLQALARAIPIVERQLDGRNSHGAVPNPDLPRRILFDALAKTFQAHSQAANAEEYRERLRQFLTEAGALLGDGVVPREDHVLDYVYPPLKERRTIP